MTSPGGPGAATTTTEDVTPDLIGSARVQRNLIANFLSLAFLIGANLVAVPLYVRLLGIEAYGLIGFYALLTAGFQVFDFGLSATMARECARYRGGALDGTALWRMLGAFEMIFLALAAAGAAMLVVAAPIIAATWLRLETLPVGTASTALVFLGLAVPVQWATGLYRGLQIGFERQVLLAGLNILFATARFLGVIGALYLFGATVQTFFAYQAILAVLELVVFAGFSRAIMPNGREPFSPAVIREVGRVLTFSSAVAFVTLCWVLITQADRLVLSKTLTLPDYGVFTLAVTVSSALVTVSTPLGQALLPRLTVLNAQRRPVAALQLYRNGTQLAALVALPAALLLALFSEQVLWIWTGDRHLASRAAPILTAYALGSGIVPLTAFPYYLQYSHGALRLHVIGQALMVALLVPAVVITATRFGPVGVGSVWTALNIAYLLVWTPIVHRKLAPGLHWPWLLKDIGVIFVPAAALAVALRGVLKWPVDRLGASAELVLASAIILSVACVASSSMRAWLMGGALGLIHGGKGI